VVSSCTHSVGRKGQRCLRSREVREVSKNGRKVGLVKKGGKSSFSATLPFPPVSSAKCKEKELMYRLSCDP